VAETCAPRNSRRQSLGGAPLKRQEAGQPWRSWPEAIAISIVRLTRARKEGGTLCAW
jgi:hypothetical protein